MDEDDFDRAILKIMSVQGVKDLRSKQNMNNKKGTIERIAKFVTSFRQLLILAIHIQDYHNEAHLILL